MRGYFLDNNIAHRNRATAITASLYKGLTQCMLMILPSCPILFAKIYRANKVGALAYRQA